MSGTIGWNFSRLGEGQLPLRARVEYEPLTIIFQLDDILFQITSDLRKEERKRKHHNSRETLPIILFQLRNKHKRILIIKLLFPALFRVSLLPLSLKCTAAWKFKKSFLSFLRLSITMNFDLFGGGPAKNPERLQHYRKHARHSLNQRSMFYGTLM